jgi:hypothetical protein
MASLVTKPRKVKPSIRSLRIGQPTNGVRALVITQDGERCGYFLKELAVDFGRGFEMTKFDCDDGSDASERTYHVHLDAQLGDSCTCKGFTYKSHCKHLDACKKLVALGAL